MTRILSISLPLSHHSLSLSPCILPHSILISQRKQFPVMLSLFPLFILTTAPPLFVQVPPSPVPSLCPSHCCSLPPSPPPGFSVISLAFSHLSHPMHTMDMRRIIWYARVCVHTNLWFVELHIYVCHLHIQTSFLFFSGPSVPNLNFSHPPPHTYIFQSSF